MRTFGAGIAALLALTMSGCVTNDPEPSSEQGAGPRAGGTVVVALDAAPDGLNPALSTLAATATVMDEVLAGPYRVGADLDYVPELLEGEPEVSTDPFAVTFRIRDDAVWSDGTPITSSDFRYSWETMTEPRWDIPFRDPPAQIESAKVLDDETIRFVFGEPYAPWKNLFLREGVLPEHVLRGEDFGTVWRDEIDISSGPFQVEEWVEGDHLTLVRNPNYWGDAAFLDRIVFRFVEDTNTLLQNLRGGEVDVAVGQPEMVPAMEDVEGLHVSVKPGSRFEFLQFDVDAVPGFVRRAIGLAIDRDAIVENIVRPAQPDAEVLDSFFYLPGQQGYRANFGVYDADPERAIALLEDEGCRRQGEGPFVCDGEELSYVFTTIGGRERSERQFEIIQEQLRQVGIDIRAQLGDIPTVVSNYQTGKAQIAGLSIDLGFTPFYRDVLLRCESPLGVFCDPRVETLLDRGVRALNEAGQERIYNRVDEIVARSLAFLPLYQVPNVLVWQERVGGIEHGLAGDPLTNPAGWFLTD